MCPRGRGNAGASLRAIGCAGCFSEEDGGGRRLPGLAHRRTGRYKSSVSVVGFPFGESVGNLPIWVTGFIGSEPEMWCKGLPTMLVDCRTRTGLSGAPVVLQRNFGSVVLEDGSFIADGRPRSRLLGVYSGRINDQSDIGIVWKTTAIRELVAHASG